MLIQPYLNFNGRCEEAIHFYKTALGAELLMLMRYSETPDPTPPGMVAPGSENKVCHATFRIGESTVMGSDGSCRGTASFQGFTLSLTVANEAEADRALPRWPRGEKCRCRWRRHSSRPASAWSKTSLESPGWSTCLARRAHDRFHDNSSRREQS